MYDSSSFRPSAGIVVSYVNSSGCGNNAPCFDRIYYTWHDADNNGGWEICSNKRCQPDYDELRIVQNGDGKAWQYNYFVDLLQVRHPRVPGRCAVHVRPVVLSATVCCDGVL